MHARGPRARRRAPSLLVAALLALLTLPVPAALAGDPAVTGTSAAGSPTEGLPIHGAGSDPAGSVTLDGRGAATASSLEGAAYTELAATGPAPCTAWTNERTAPSRIRVYRTKTGTVDLLDFRSYVRKVVTAEFRRTWPFQLLTIGSIAVKQNGWYWTMRGRDWTNLTTAGFATPPPIVKVALADGRYQWQTSAASASGAGKCWDVTDNPNFDQCYDCYGVLDPNTAPRTQAAVDATWRMTVRRPRLGVQSFFAPGYAGRLAATCPSMSTIAEWETWFTGSIDFNQAYVCATEKGESAAMLLRRFLSSALEIRDAGRADLTGDGLGDVPVLRQESVDPAGWRLDPATADRVFLGSAGIPAPLLGADPGFTVARAVGRLGRTDRASLVSLAIDASGGVSVLARKLTAPGTLATTRWWSGRVAGLDPASRISLAVADITGDMRPDVVATERATRRDPSTGATLDHALRVWVLSTTDGGAAGRFVRWAELGPFAAPTRLERLGDVDGDGRLDLVFAPGDSPGFLAARADRSGGTRLLPAEPYGTLAAPANPGDWRFFALADVGGTGIDAPVVGSVAGGPFVVRTAPADCDETAYPIVLGDLADGWTDATPALAEGRIWVGDVDRDGRAELANVNGSLASSSGSATTTLAVATTSGDALLAIVGVASATTPTSLPTLRTAPLIATHVVAPGERGILPPDSTLVRLDPNVGRLSPVFAPDLTSFVVVVPLAQTTIALRPWAAHPWARIVVKNRIVRSGTWSDARGLVVGWNRFAITVSDDTARSSYTVWVVRAAAPPAPVITKAYAALGGKLRVFWGTTGDGGSPITGWVVRYRPAGTTTWSVVRIADPARRDWIIRELPIGVRYEVSVAARNIVGVGAYTPRITLLTK